MIKTINLDGTEQAVKFTGKHTHFHVHSLGSEVLVSLAPNIERGADGVLIVQGGGAGYVHVDMPTDMVYLAGSGEVQVVGSGNAFSPFKVGAEGGGNISFITEGGTVTGTVDYPILSLNLYGDSVQDGTPTPDVPIDIVSIGDDGTVIITVDNGSDITISAEITSGLPLCLIGDVRDELVYRADGTGKIIKRTAKTVFDGTNERGIVMSYDETTGVVQWRSNFLTNMHINNGSVWGNGLCSHAEYNAVVSMAFSHFAPILDNNYRFLRFWFQNIGVQTNNELNAWLQSNPVTVIYQLETPQEIELSAAEMTLLMQLQTFDGTTYIYNDEDAEMKVKIAANSAFAVMIKPVLDGFDKRITNLEAALTAFMEG